MASDQTSEYSSVSSSTTDSLERMSYLLDVIVLNVGGQSFNVLRSTLVRGSTYFTFLSDADNTAAPKAPNGFYFVDADPELFQHILCYLRRGTFPIFYDKAKGHDYALYNALMGEAAFFGMNELVSWLTDKQYEKVVQIKHSSVTYDEDSAVVRPKSMSSNVEIEFHPRWWTEKVYVCPRGIWVHRGHPSACGRQCRSAQGDAEDTYEDEENFSMLEIHRETIFDQAAASVDMTLDDTASEAS